MFSLFQLKDKSCNYWPTTPQWLGRKQRKQFDSANRFRSRPIIGDYNCNVFFQLIMSRVDPGLSEWGGFISHLRNKVASFFCQNCMKAIIYITQTSILTFVIDNEKTLHWGWLFWRHIYIVIFAGSIRNFEDGLPGEEGEQELVHWGVRGSLQIKRIWTMKWWRCF